MLVCHPFELLHEVLDQLPSPADYDSARERTETLIACSLISSECRAERTSLFGYKLVHTLHVWRMSRPETEAVWDRTLAAVQQFSSVRSLDLYGKDELVVELDVLATSLPLLTSVRLSHVVLPPISDNAIFPRLLSFTLHCICHPSTSTACLPSVRNCPALRALTVNPASGSNKNHALCSSFVEGLARQLDMLQVQGEYASVNSVPRSPVEILISVDDSDVGPPVAVVSPVVHLRYCELREKASSHAFNLLGQLLGTASRSLHLPSNLDHLAWSELDAPIDELLALCDSLGLEVLWYDPAEEGHYALSPLFWRYAKRLKAEKATAAADEGM